MKIEDLRVGQFVLHTIKENLSYGMYNSIDHPSDKQHFFVVKECRHGQKYYAIDDTKYDNEIYASIASETLYDFEDDLLMMNVLFGGERQCSESKCVHPTPCI